MSLNKALDNIFYEVFNYKGKLTDDLDPSSISGWDSVAHIAMIESLESHFSIMLTTEEMVQMTSVRKIKDVLKNYNIEH